jgi:hypothetical protein
MASPGFGRDLSLVRPHRIRHGLIAKAMGWVRRSKGRNVERSSGHYKYVAGQRPLVVWSWFEVGFVLCALNLNGTL